MTDIQRQSIQPSRSNGGETQTQIGQAQIARMASGEAPPIDTSSDSIEATIASQVTHMKIPFEGDRRKEIYRVAADRFQQNPDWVTFFREILGVEGIIRKALPNPEDLATFEQQEEYAEIQQMVAKLRERSKHQTESNEPTRVITVRLPKSLHESLRAEAHQKRTSMNQLCISKLLQLINNELVPSD